MKYNTLTIIYVMAGTKTEDNIMNKKMSIILTTAYLATMIQMFLTKTI